MVDALVYRSAECPSPQGFVMGIERMRQRLRSPEGILSLAPYAVFFRFEGGFCLRVKCAENRNYDGADPDNRAVLKIHQKARSCPNFSRRAHRRQ